MNIKIPSSRYILCCIFLPIFFSGTAAAQNKIFYDTDTIVVADIKFRHFEQKPTTKKPAKQTATRPPKNKNHQYEVRGYINDQYVRINIQITEDNVLSGYMFIENHPAEYVYGELVNGTLYMYDTKGELYTVLLAK